MNETTTTWQYTVLRWLTCVLLVVSPLLIKYSFFFPLVTPKKFFIELCVFLALPLFVGGLMQKGEKEYLGFGKISLTVGLFLSILFISSLFGIDPHASLFGSFGRGVSFFNLLFLSGLAGIITHLVRKNALSIKDIGWSLLTSGAVISLVSLFDSQGFFPIAPKARLFILARNGSLFGNSSYAGVFLLFVIFFGIYLFVTARKPYQKIISLLGIILAAISPVLINSQLFLGKLPFTTIVHQPWTLLGNANAAILGIIAGVIIAFVAYLSFSKNKKTRIVGLVGGGIIITVFLVAGIMLLSPNTKLHKVYVEQKSDNRMLFWGIALQAVKERPLLGYGYNNFQQVYQSHFDAKIFSPGYAAEKLIDRPHNTLLEYASLTGVLGLLAYLSIFVALFWVLIRLGIHKQEKRKEAALFIGLLSAYFLQNLFLFDSNISFLCFFVVIGLVASFDDNLLKKVEISEKVKSDIVTISACLVSVFLIIFFVILPRREAKSWNKYVFDNRIVDLSKQKFPASISLIGDVGDSSDAVDNINKHIDGMYTSLTPEVVPYVEQYLLNIMSALRAELERHPQNYRLNISFVNTVSLYLGITNKQDKELFDEASKSMERAFSVNNKNPDDYISYAQFKLLERDPKTAFELIKKGIEIAPLYTPTYDFGYRLAGFISNPQFKKFLDMKKAETKSLTNVTQ